MSPSLTPQHFVQRWRSADQKERSVAQPHFIDLCLLIEHPTPVEADPNTNLYNQCPTWLDLAHKKLDAAVAAYGWPADLADKEILARLLALNLERAAK